MITNQDLDQLNRLVVELIDKACEAAEARAAGDAKVHCALARREHHDASMKYEAQLALLRLKL